MSLLKIIRVKDAVEAGWGVHLLNQQGVLVLKTCKGLTKAEAVATAKSLKHRGGRDAVASSIEAGFTAWTKVPGESSVFRLSAHEETDFEVVGDHCADIAAVTDILVDVDIVWDDPSDDPAGEDKRADRTKPQGWPGS